MAETAYPLSWPAGWKRTKFSEREQRAPFTVGEEREQKYSTWENNQRIEKVKKVQSHKEVTIAVATERLEQQLELLGADHPVLSTNMELKLNGAPRSDRRDPDDTGAAIWFTLKGKRIVFACDKWRRVGDNIAALAAHIRAIRSVERYGVGSLEQAFRGYQALPAPGFTHEWRQILVGATTLEEAEKIYRDKAKKHHPDQGGNPTQMAELNAAIRDARKEFGAEVAA